jgi:hypothetical protein
MDNRSCRSRSVDHVLLFYCSRSVAHQVPELASDSLERDGRLGYNGGYNVPKAGETGWKKLLLWKNNC